MIEQLLAEATECDFKVALEVKKPKSWLKSVSAFSNGIGGTLFFGIADDRSIIGLTDIQSDAEAISRFIKERITPLPQFVLTPILEDNKNILALQVAAGSTTPYYYKADGVMEAYIRMETEKLPGYTQQLKPEFFSTTSDFRVVLKNANYIMNSANMIGTEHDAEHEDSYKVKQKRLLKFCSEARSRDEMQRFLAISSRPHFTKYYLKPLLESGQLKMTIPDKPKSKNQRYIASNQ